MIVKIATDVLENSWWIEDCIRKVSINKALWADIRSDNCLRAHQYDPDFVCVRDNKKDTDEVMVLVCRMDSGDERSLCFDGRAYLLNDNGKTIDVICA